MAYTQANAATRQPIKTLLHFDGQWRTYQKRVLDEADNYLKDKKSIRCPPPSLYIYSTTSQDLHL